MTTLTRSGRVAGIAVIVALLFPSAPAPALEGAQFQGFGAVTRGGAGGAVVRVTTLADSGPGSLREAAAGGERTIVFDVAGEIALNDYIRVRGRFVTIDGFTAPSPGITLRGHGIAIEGSAGAHDVIVRGVRVRNALKDGIRVAYGASNVVIDHVSVHGSGDGNLDISEARDVTVSWSILAEPALEEKNMLIKYAPAHVTLHHNLFTEARQRNPQVRIDDAGTLAHETTVDMRNNVVWRWPSGYGTLIWYGPRANVVNNYFASPGSSAAEQARALDVQANTGARAYVAGNVSGDGVLTVNTVGTEGTPFDAPPVTMTSACEAALAVVQGAGMRPLDPIDARYVSAVTLPGCVGSPPPPSGPAQPDLVIASLGAPSSATPGSVLTVTVTTRNSGTAVASPSTTALRLSLEAGLDPVGPALASVAVPSLAAGAADTATVNLTVPSGTASGTYRLVARADDGAVVAEWSDGNNTTAAGLIVGDGSSGGGAGSPDLTVVELTAPRGLTPGASFVVRDKVKNRGAGPSPATTVAFYLSSDRRSVAGATALGTRAVAPLAVGASSAGTTTLSVPAGTVAGDYYLIAVADAGSTAAEAVESNNVRARSVDLR